MAKDRINILAVGDVVGMAAARYLQGKLSNIRQALGIDLVIVNGENSADGNGILPQSAEAIFDAGADVITGGNHSFRRREVYTYLDDTKYCIRPANMPGAAPGYGYTVIDAGGVRILVINLLGTMFLDPVESPFTCADRILESQKGKYDIAVVDFHAEATSEKAALARYLDGRVSVLFGTHTHIPTADARVFAQGTGFITDLGMTGPVDSILGVKSDIVINKFLTHMPVRFDQAQGEITGAGAVFEIDKQSGKCISAKRIDF